MDSTLLQRAKDTDLLAMAQRYTTLKRAASSGGGEYAGPCPMCGGHDRFHVQPQEGRWLCRHCTEGKWQDVIALQMRLANQAFPEAVQALAGGICAEMPRAPARHAAPPLCEEIHGPPSEAWQQRARQIIAEAETALWTANGERARAWLNARGLADLTIQAAHLGLIPARRREPAPNCGLEGNDVYLAHGILIPCQVHGVIWYLKIRRPAGDPKYIQVRGGRPGLYWAQSLPGHETVVFCEGEFDTLLLWQAAGDVAAIVTLGSASNRLDVASWGIYLLEAKRQLLAYDLDHAGAQGAAALGWLANARRLEIPQLEGGGKDITDYYKAGGDLGAWLVDCVRSTLLAENAKKGTSEPFSDDLGHRCPGDALQAVRSHPAYIGGLPICRQPTAVQETWWAAVFAERGIPDPAPLEEP